MSTELTYDKLIRSSFNGVRSDVALDMIKMNKDKLIDCSILYKSGVIYLDFIDSSRSIKVLIPLDKNKVIRVKVYDNSVLYQTHLYESGEELLNLMQYNKWWEFHPLTFDSVIYYIG